MGKLSKTIFINTAVAIGATYVFPLGWTYRTKHINYKPEVCPAIYAIWHGRQWGLMNIKGEERKKMNLLISPSTDGEIIKKLSRFHGYPVIRGSVKRRGAEAVRNIINALEDGQYVAYTVDGPKGPIHRVKEGIIKIAQMSQAPIIPMVPFTKSTFRFNSWDKYELPLWFSKAAIAYGDPIHVPKDLSNEEVEQYRQKVEDELFRLDDVARKEYGFGI